MYALLEPGFSEVYEGLVFAYDVRTKQPQFFPFPKSGVEIPVSVAEVACDFHVGPLKSGLFLMPSE